MLTESNNTVVSAPTQPPKPAGSSAQREGIRSILSTVAVLIIAPLIAILLTKFVFQPYEVDGPSMQTTLYDNDRLIVWKLSRTWSAITGHPYIPGRGDVIIFTEPKLKNFGQDPDKQLIKRVVALPGEKVIVRNNVLTVYNLEHPEGFQPDATLPYGNVIKDTGTDGEWVVGTNELFVAGDNRGNSLDSRLFGPISAKRIVGKLSLRMLPVNQFKRF